MLAIVGAGVDMAAAIKAVRALAPAARTLATGGELADFTKAVEALQKSKQLDEKIAAAADKAATARKTYAAAKGELSATLGKAYSLPGPFTDPEVYRALVKMAAAKIKEGTHSLAGFLAEFKQARLAAKLGELSSEELAKAKQAFEQVEALAKLVSDPALLDTLLSRREHILRWCARVRAKPAPNPITPSTEGRPGACLDGRVGGGPVRRVRGVRGRPARQAGGAADAMDPAGDVPDGLTVAYCLATM